MVAIRILLIQLDLVLSVCRSLTIVLDVQSFAVPPALRRSGYPYYRYPQYAALSPFSPLRAPWRKETNADVQLSVRVHEGNLIPRSHLPYRISLGPKDVPNFAADCCTHWMRKKCWPIH